MLRRRVSRGQSREPERRITPKLKSTLTAPPGYAGRYPLTESLLPTRTNMSALDSHESTMWLSTRRRLSHGDTDWTGFADFVGLPHLSVVRSIDSCWNRCIEGNFAVASMLDLWETLASLRPAESETEYHLLCVDSAHHDTFTHPQLTFLGYDLSDETWTSSLLNCGRWEGELAPLAAGSQPNGLLDLSSAKTAQEILPVEWDDDPHSYVTIWALYEVTRSARNG